MKANLVKYYNLIVRLLIIVGTLVFLAYQVFIKKDFIHLYAEAQQWMSGVWFVVGSIAVLLLMPINWGLESLKWKYLVAKSEKVSLTTASKAVYAGISISSLSPNRVGEFFGRVFMLKETSFWRGVIMTVLGSYAQTFVTLFFGIFSIGYFLYPYMLDKGIVNHTQFVFLFSLVIIGLVVVFLSFLWIAKFTFIWKRMKSNVRVALNILNSYQPLELLKVFALSVARYLVFSLQYYLLLRVLQVEIDFFAGMGLISLIFFFNTVRPSIALLEIGVRYAIAYQVFDLYYIYGSQDIFYSESQILVASSALWFINIVLPALLGLFFVKELKFFRAQKQKISS